MAPEEPAPPRALQPVDGDRRDPRPHIGSSAPTPGPAALDVDRAARRLLDAETEFDAALDEGASMSGLAARESEIRRAAAALHALQAPPPCDGGATLVVTPSARRRPGVAGGTSS